ncbi:MAG: DUF4097 family beta strand repeat-containing protein [Gemmatimonadales bacterium]
MADSNHAASPLHRFWRGWRREIIRGGVTLALVLGIGLVATNRIGSFRASVLDMFSDGGERQSAEALRWVGRMPAGQQVWIRNTNGGITVEAALGDSLEVVATKSWRGSDSTAVRVVALPHEGGITFCAMWRGEEARCESRGSYRMRGMIGREMAETRVRFAVRLPRGVAVDASTLNGAVNVAGATAPIVAVTTNGSIDATSEKGSIKARTANGSIRATVKALPPTGALDLETMNGSITATLPPKLNAELDAKTATGRIETDFALTMSGQMSQRHIVARIGTGGPRLKLATITGTIRLRELGREPQ